LKSLMLGEKLIRQPMFWLDVFFLSFKIRFGSQNVLPLFKLLY